MIELEDQSDNVSTSLIRRLAGGLYTLDNGNLFYIPAAQMASRSLEGGVEVVIPAFGLELGETAKITPFSSAISKIKSRFRFVGAEGHA
jgi:hypothetical protein